MTMQTVTIGPVGALRRGAVRSTAFQLGLRFDEQKSVLTSLFRITGPQVHVRQFVDWLKRMADEDAAIDHRHYVADMEAAEKCRHRWGRLFGRGRRLEPLDAAEADEVRGLLREAYVAHTDATEDAGKRLRRGMTAAVSTNPALHPDVVSTLLSVPMRYLQHDLRGGDVKLPKDLRLRILALRMPMDTWDD